MYSVLSSKGEQVVNGTGCYKLEGSHKRFLFLARL